MESVNANRYARQKRVNQLKRSIGSIAMTLVVIAVVLALARGMLPWFNAFVSTVK